ncbi:hypothetical protein MAP00_006553 [Monascus purpureus]|nr:hypothetical protein MAP00_006553 [Monascus purpureus]
MIHVLLYQRQTPFLSLTFFLNPEIDQNCTNLELGAAYCVEAVGSISTYSGYPTTTSTPWITVLPATFSSVDTLIPTSTSGVGYNCTTSLLPTASGTIPGCERYRNYDNSSEAYNDCSYVAFAYQETTDDLLQWNPSLSTNLSACDFQAGYSYCVKLTNLTTTPGGSYCVPVNSTTVVAGTAADCDCFTVIHGYDQGYTCSDLESDYLITERDLMTWNTWLSPDCDTNLFANLSSSDTRPVCVAVNASAPTGSAAPPPTTTTATTTTGTMGPTPTGIVANCTQYHTVQSGNTCDSIEASYGISFTQFYAWNPSIGSQCENLWLGYVYCVNGPIATGTGSAPVAPTQMGIVSNCNEYYTVASGDTCSGIESQFNDTFAELYQWNPAIGSNCKNLWVGYLICVGVSS